MDIAFPWRIYEKKEKEKKDRRISITIQKYKLWRRRRVTKQCSLPSRYIA